MAEARLAAADTAGHRRHPRALGGRARSSRRAAHMRGVALRVEPLVGVIAVTHTALRTAAVGPSAAVVLTVTIGAAAVVVFGGWQAVRQDDRHLPVLARSLLTTVVITVACAGDPSLRFELVTWYPVVSITTAFVLGLRVGWVPVAFGSVSFFTVLWWIDDAATALVRLVIMVVGGFFAAAVGDLIVGSLAEAENEAAKAERHRVREAQLRGLIDAAPWGIVLYEDGRRTFINQPTLDLTGLTEEQLRRDGFSEVIHPEDRSTYEVARRAMERGEPVSFRIRIIASGVVRHLEVAMHPVVGDDVGSDEQLGTLATLRDVTADMAQRREVERFRTVADVTSDLVAMALPNTSVMYLNRAAREFLGITDDTDVAHHDLTDLWPGWTESQLPPEAFAAASEGTAWQGEMEMTSPVDGRRVPMSVVAVGLLDETGACETIAVTYRDLTERHRLEQNLAHAASHDVLTGLPNRDQLFTELERRRSAHEPIAVLFCDLDDFKLVNDSLGHSVGDQLLIALAARLRAASRVGDVVGRLGGDEFLLICRDVADEEEARRVADRVLNIVRDPIVIDGRRHVVSASIGIAMCTDGQRGAGDLIQEADIAMYRAKLLGRRRAEVFDEGMRTEVVERLELERDLRAAVDAEQLELFFQPIFEIFTGRISGMEALVRWRHPERGLLLPGAFLGVAEAAGLGPGIGRWVVEAAAQSAAAMREVIPSIHIGVNMSAVDLAEADVVDHLVAAVGRAGVPASALVVEVTEHVLMSDMDDARQRLVKLRELGVGVAVDDFGTGYSNLALLRLMPVDFLKIDRGFVDGLGTEPGDTQIVRVVLSLAAELGLVAVAEGVENRDQELELQRLGCLHAQGFHFARPMPLDEALAVLHERRHLVEG